MPIEWVDTVPTLPKRPADSNKGMFGTVLIVAGGRGMAGAAALVGGSALRCGAGRVRVACPAEIQPTVASFEPSYMTYPLADDQEGLIRFPACRRALEKLLDGSTVLAIGPGIGQTDEIAELVRWVIDEVTIPVVLDADALNALAKQPDWPGRLKRPAVVTPHPGEFARLVGKTVEEVQADRDGMAVALAARSAPLIVVLKGDKTVVTDGTRVYHNTSGNPGMATGGAGDALTGVIAALIGQRLPAFEAAVLGTYVHGLAGDIARDQNGVIGMIAGDIVDALPDAFVHLEG